MVIDCNITVFTLDDDHLLNPTLYGPIHETVREFVPRLYGRVSETILIYSTVTR